MSYKNIIVEINPPIATILINRPEKLNALNVETVTELADVFRKLSANDSVGGVLLTGAGEKAFVAGADISEIQNLGADEGRKFAAAGQAAFNLIEQLGKPVIALVNGYALGGGCELAMACHLRIAGEEAKFGQPEVNLGIIPGYGGTQRMPRIIGKGIALQYLLSGEMIGAQRAHEIGLVNKVVATAELKEAGQKMLGQILSKGPLAVRYVLNAVNEGLNTDLEKALNIEASYFGKACATEDMKEGTSAFLEKRKANFRGK
ncbi:MAG: enoyl-CoA hydratase/isomerase family protein [Calditrichaceae bacterium]